MITLQDVRQSFDEKKLPYQDKENYIVIENPTLGEEKVPAAVFVQINDNLLEIYCRVSNPINLELNENVLKAIYELNKNYLFYTVLADLATGSEDQRIVALRYNDFASRIENADEVINFVVQSLQTLDSVYAEIMRAKWAK